MPPEFPDTKEDLRIRDLKTFFTLVETGSFSKTAERLGITQGTVSNHIDHIEKYFDAPLFHRGERARKGENLTQAGEKVLHCAKEIAILLNRTKNEVERLKAAVSGTLRIATSTIPGEHILPKFLATFKAKYPAVEFAVDLSDSGKSLEKLLTKKADLATVGSLMGYEAEIETFTIAEEEIVLIVPLTHELFTKDAIDPHILREYTFLTREKTSGTRKETEKILKNEDISFNDFKRVIELGSTEAVITAVSEGYGISMISSIAAKKAENYVKIRPLKNVENKRNLYMVRRIHESYPILVETFWDFVKNNVHETQG